MDDRMRKSLTILSAFLVAIVGVTICYQATPNVAYAETGQQQADGIQVGATVQVVVDRLNLRDQAGTDRQVVILLIRDEKLTVTDGPLSASGCTWWKLRREGDGVQGWAAARCAQNVYLQPVPDQPPPPPTLPPSTTVGGVDWRGNLTCAPQHQAYRGILYCTGTDETAKPTHVVVVDLESADVAFEYILPTGYSDGHDGEAECRDPNVPAWGGPDKGCYRQSRKDLYPVMSIEDAAKRAVQVRSSSKLALVINADYGAPNATHGPEGLLVVRGKRLDGADHCDDDYNAALRPWLGLGNGRDGETGLIRALIDRLPTDSSALPGWLYTGVGGGPWLVRDGQVLPGLSSCAGEKTLGTLEPITNCTRNLKPDKDPPLGESYGSGSCGLAPHTAAGLSRDGRWLFMVITTGNSRPDVVARYMVDDLGVWQALKFDGGGSTQLQYNAQQPVVVDPLGAQRSLTNFLAVYATQGQGIQLPLQAEPGERVYYRVVIAGETAQFELAVKNTGSLTWHPDDQIELKKEPWFILSPAAESFPLSSVTGPGETATWSYEIEADGIAYHRFQMVQHGQAFGPDIAVVVIGLPQEWADRREEFEQEIQEMIDEWKARGDAELERLIDELKKWLEAELRKKGNEICTSIFGSTGLVLGALAFIVPYNRRYLSRQDQEDVPKATL